MALSLCNNPPTREQWNDFLIANNGSFLQSFEWGALQAKEGRSVFRFQYHDIRYRDIVLQAQVLKHRLPFGKSYFYIPYGPCFKQGIGPAEETEAWQCLLKELAALAKKEQAIFLHFEFFQYHDIGYRDIGGLSLPFIVKTKKDIQPKRTWLVDLTKSENELLAGCTQKCRYNINLAKRKGVRIIFSDNYQPIFYQLLKQKASEKDFQPFSESHYKNLFSAASLQFKVKLCLAEYQEKTIAAYIMVLFAKRATFLHGASDRKYSNLKPLNLLQWERMLLAKQMGYSEADFWGIDEKKWPGFTYFKKTFPGQEFNYPERYDVVFRKNWYKLYNLASRFR